MRRISPSCRPYSASQINLLIWPIGAREKGTMARCRECNSKVSKSTEYCPQCGVRDPAHYNVQAHDETKVRKRSNFVVPLLGVGAILVLATLYAGNKSSDVRPSVTAAKTATPDYNLLHNKEFVRKNPHYGEAIRRLIASAGYRCPALVNLTADPLSAEDAVEAWCGIGPNGAVPNWRYKVFPQQLRVSVCSGIISC